ncbi:hypothetical protein LXL04_016932 [Taraxacum kok-saghyz]
MFGTIYKSGCPRKQISLTVKYNRLPSKANLYYNRLPSKANLSNRGIVIPAANCALCGGPEESEVHLFLECTWVKEVWALIETWCELDLSMITNIEQLLGVAHSLLQSSTHKKVIHAVILSAIWSIWKARNEITFNNKTTSPSVVAEEIKHNSFFWVKNRGKMPQLRWDSWSIFPFTVN